MRVTLFGLALTAAAGLGAVGSPPASAGVVAPPNVVVITTDDQDAASIADSMPITKERIGAAGATFRQSFVNFPLCCPSRATFLTGQYSNNHGVNANVPPLGGFQAFDPASTLPVWLRPAGTTPP